MYTLASSFEIPGITPQQAVHWWLSMDNETYTRWHHDHHAWQWQCSGKDKAESGDVVRFHETIDRFDLKIKAKLSKLDPSGFLKFDVIGAPASFSFRYEEKDAGTLVTYEAAMGFKSFPGRLLDMFIKKMYPPDEYGPAITGHVKEEHQLIKHQVS